jgi:hypothetical protein
MHLGQRLQICHRCAHHRQLPNGKMVCNDDPDRRNIIDIGRAGQCPHKYFELGLPASAMATTANFYTRMWDELHRRALEFAGEGLAELAWFYRWCQGVASCGGCLMHWLEFIAEYPPDLRSAETYFRWTVIARNTVSARRGVDDLWSVDRSLAKYSQA